MTDIHKGQPMAVLTHRSHSLQRGPWLARTNPAASLLTLHCHENSQDYLVNRKLDTYLFVGLESLHWDLNLNTFICTKDFGLGLRNLMKCAVFFTSNWAQYIS